MPISVISMEDMKGPVGNISDVLSKTAGMQVRMSGGEGSSSRLSVRGLEGKRIGYFMDDLALNDNNEALISTTFRLTLSSVLRFTKA